MDSTHIGKNAEQAVADYFADRKYKIIAQNWRTRWCEVDIIATKSKVAYFIEVKYRKSSVWGDGLDAITQKKLQQMLFAANMWSQTNNWHGDSRLVVVSASGEPVTIDDVIEL